MKTRTVTQQSKQLCGIPRDFFAADVLTSTSGLALLLRWMEDHERQEEAFDLVEENTNGELKLHDHPWQKNWLIHKHDLFIRLRLKQFDGFPLTPIGQPFPRGTPDDHVRDVISVLPNPGNPPDGPWVPVFQQMCGWTEGEMWQENHDRNFGIACSLLTRMTATPSPNHVRNCPFSAKSPETFELTLQSFLKLLRRRLLVDQRSLMTSAR